MKRKGTLICITRNEPKQNKSEQKEGQRVACHSNSICMNSSYVGCDRDPSSDRAPGVRFFRSGFRVSKEVSGQLALYASDWSKVAR